MTARMLTPAQQVGKFCLYEWFVDGKSAICGAPAVAKAGNHPICQEHLEFVRSSQPTPLEKAIVRRSGK